MNRVRLALAVFLVCGAAWCFGGLESTAIRDTAEWVLRKFGKGVAGNTLEQITQSTSSLVAKYGEECLPLLRQTGHAGFAALEEAGEKAPAVIKLYARKGDDAIWIISEPRRLAIFLKHGDSAADALLKHPNLAETLIGKYGADAVGALNAVSRTGAQRLAIMAEDGTLDRIGRQPEVLGVIRQYGDAALDFVWKHKGALAAAAGLAAFLVDPQGFIQGTKKLVVGPVLSPIASSLNWTLIAVLVLSVIFGPFIANSVAKSYRAARSGRTNDGPGGGRSGPVP